MIQNSLGEVSDSADGYNTNATLDVFQNPVVSSRPM
jgi:hypothetical protein